MQEPEEASSGPRRRVGLVLVPTVFLALWLAPLPLDPPAHRLAAIFAAVVIAWTSEVIPIAGTALMIGPALVLAEITGPKEAFASYADPVLFIFVGGFFLARSMQRHGLDVRLARAVLSIGWINRTPRRARAGFMLAAFVLSMWTSNTATTALLLPILLGDRAKRADTDRRALVGDVLALAYASSVGGLGTLIGSPPNLITARLLSTADAPFGFPEWFAIGFPTAVILTIAVEIVMHRLAPAAAIVVPTGDPRPWSKGEKVTAVAFGLAIVGWVFPGVLQAMGSPLAEDANRLFHAGVVAMIASFPLFLFTADDGKAVLPWREANAIDWGIIMLFGGGIALGEAMNATGLAGAMGHAFVAGTGISSLFMLTVVATVFTIFFTEASSNTATASMLVPLVLAAATALDVSPYPPVLAVGLAASCAFMLPIATGPNAVAYASGVVPQTTMIRAGFVLNVVCSVLLLGILFVLSPR